MNEPITRGTSTASKRRLLNNVADLSAFIGTILLITNRWAYGFEHPFMFTGIGLWALFLLLRLVQWKQNSHRRNLSLLVYLIAWAAFTVFYLIVMQDSPFRELIIKN